MGTGWKTLFIASGTLIGAAVGFYIQEKLMEEHRQQGQAAPRHVQAKEFEEVVKSVEAKQSEDFLRDTRKQR